MTPLSLYFQHKKYIDLTPISLFIRICSIIVLKYQQMFITYLVLSSDDTYDYSGDEYYETDEDVDDHEDDNNEEFWPFPSEDYVELAVLINGPFPLVCLQCTSLLCCILNFFLRITSLQKILCPDCVFNYLRI